MLTLPDLFKLMADKHHVALDVAREQLKGSA
jgi:hypothetical protein